MDTLTCLYEPLEFILRFKKRLYRMGDAEPNAIDVRAGERPSALVLEAQLLKNVVASAQYVEKMCEVHFCNNVSLDVGARSPTQPPLNQGSVFFRQYRQNILMPAEIPHDLCNFELQRGDGEEKVRSPRLTIEI